MRLRSSYRLTWYNDGFLGYLNDDLNREREKTSMSSTQVVVVGEASGATWSLPFQTTTHSPGMGPWLRMGHSVLSECGILKVGYGKEGTEKRGRMKLNQSLSKQPGLSSECSESYWRSDFCPVNLETKSSKRKRSRCREEKWAKIWHPGAWV